MAAAKKDAVVDATRMQSDQKNAELKAAYIKAREKALAENPNLLGTSIPEWTPGMNLDAAWKTLSFATGGQGNANAGVRQRSSLDRTVEPWNPLAAMPSREASAAVPHKKGTMSEKSIPHQNPFDPNPRTKKGFGDTSTSELDRQEKSIAWMADPKNNKGRTEFRRYQSAPATGGDPGRIKGRVVDGLEGYQSDPEQYLRDSMPGGLRELMQDKDRSTIQKAVFGSPQVGTAGSPDYKAASPDFQAATENSADPVSGKPILGKSAKGTAQVGTAPSADFQAAVAGKGYYDTPYGRISARKGRVGDISTPTDLHRTSLMEGLESMGRTYNPEARYGSKENPIYRGAFAGSQKSEYNENPDEDQNDGTNYSYYGPLGEGPQNKVTNPGIEKSNKSLLDQTDALRKKYPLIFEKDSEQNKAYVADFNAAIPNYKELNDLEKLNARTGYMSKMKDNPAYAGIVPLNEVPPSQPNTPPGGPSSLQPEKK